MSIKNSVTTTDYLPWATMQDIVTQLEADKLYKYANVIAIGSGTGLRFSDISRLTWGDLSNDTFEIREKKTNKPRKVTVGPWLRSYIDRYRSNHKVNDDTIIVTLTIQSLNRSFKRIAKQYSLDMRFSTHSLRKTFGRKIWQHNDHSERSIVLLCAVFNHRHTSETRKYLGIKDDEIKEVYMSL